MPSWFLTIPPGLEPVVARELDDLGHQADIEPGGVVVSWPLEQGAALVPMLRTPSRALLELARGPTKSVRDLGDLAASVDWSPYLKHAPKVKVSVRGTRLPRRDLLAKKLEKVIASRLAGRSTDPDQTVFVQVKDGIATLSLDAGGLLHRRGWRLEQGKASLRENIASCLLIAGGFDGSAPLLDPFCGAGTIPIEAALLAAGASPHAADRSFAMHAWPAVSPQSLPHPATAEVPIAGSDNWEQAIAQARNNAHRAAITADFALARINEARPPAEGPGFVITNPPYGKRLGRQVAGIYAAFGEVLRQQFAGWAVAFLTTDDGLARRVDRAAECLTRFEVGGIGVGLYVFTP